MHSPKPARRILVAVLLGCLVAPGTVVAQNEDTAKGGTIEGVVTYEADSKRPWRYSRYYIKNRKAGLLAEAVVALESKSLDKTKRTTQPNTAVMDQQNFQFVPETLAIQAGDRVKFLNSDGVTHNVLTSHLYHSFNVNLGGGEVHIETFKKGGGIKRPYFLGCAYHSAMRAWIYVFNHPYFQMTKADGRFRLSDVPPGKYELKLVHPAGELSWSQKVNVEAGKTLKFEIKLSPDHKSSKNNKGTTK